VHRLIISEDGHAAASLWFSAVLGAHRHPPTGNIPNTCAGASHSQEHDPQYAPRTAAPNHHLVGPCLIPLPRLSLPHKPPSRRRRRASPTSCQTAHPTTHALTPTMHPPPQDCRTSVVGGAECSEPSRCRELCCSAVPRPPPQRSHCTLPLAHVCRHRRNERDHTVTAPPSLGDASRRLPRPPNSSAAYRAAASRGASCRRSGALLAAVGPVRPTKGASQCAAIRRRRCRLPPLARPGPSPWQ